MSTEGAFEHRYDVFEGRLVSGAAAYEAAIEAGTDPHDLAPLAIVLGDGGMQADKQPPLDVSNWTRADAVTLVSWLGHEVLGQETKLIDDHTNALYRLGLGPSSKKIGGWGGYSVLYEKAGLTNVYKRGIYNSWDVDDFAAYVAKIARTTPKTQSIKDRIDELARQGEGPSYKIIYKRGLGGLKALLARKGYYDFQAADNEDYLNWAVDFKFSNNAMPIDSGALDLLSPKRRAPSRSGVVRRFGTVAALNEAADDLYYTELDRIDAQNRFAFQQIMEGIHEGFYPTGLFVGCSTEAELRHAAAKFKLLAKLSPSLTPFAQAEAAGKTTKTVVKEIIRESDGTITLADIEEAAVVLGIFDDLWPIDRKKPGLRV